MLTSVTVVTEVFRLLDQDSFKKLVTLHLHYDVWSRKYKMLKPKTMTELYSFLKRW